MSKFKCRVYGIIVVVASFLIWTCAFGTSNSIGLYNIDFQNSFNTSSAAVSLVGALNTGVFFGAGPIVGILNLRWGCRKIAVVGAIFSCTGLAVMPFSPNIAYMYFFYGILNGIGNSLVVISSQLLCSDYFLDHRAVVSSFVLSGTGLGSTAFPYIINKLIQTYGWRGSLLLLCGLNLHLLVCALLLFPVINKTCNIEVIIKPVTSSVEHRNNCKAFVTSVSSNASTDENKIKIKRQKDILIGNCESRVILCCGRFKGHLCKIKNREFIIFLISSCLFNFGYNSVVIFLPQHSVAVGFDKNFASMALTLMGAGLFVGCLVGGLLGGRNSKIVVLITGSVAFGVAVAMLVFFKQSEIYMTLSFLAGLFSGFQTAHMFGIPCDILGDDTKGIGFGYVMLSVGVGMMTGPPLAGSLVDHYKDTNYVLYLSAATTIMSGVIMCPHMTFQISKKCSSNSAAKTTRTERSAVTLVSVISHKIY